MLRRRWAKVKEGEGQTVLLSGEAGIGKSHLTVAFAERLKGERFLRIRCFCSPQHTNSALYPIIDHVERSAGFARDDALQTKLDKLDALLRQSWSSAEDSALFVEMLSLTNDGRYPVVGAHPAAAPSKDDGRTCPASRDPVRLRPALVIFEDAHWSDPTSLELMGRLASHIASHRVLLVISFRPEFEAPWIERAHVTALALNRLAPRDVDVMIDHIVGNNPLPAAVRQDIIERTDGIPLFVEEMTKAVLETSWRTRPGEPTQVPSSAMAVPASLHASLMARLDRLAAPKKLRRSERLSAANFRMSSWLRSHAGRRRSWKCSSTNSCGQGCCSATALRPTPTICSSTPSCKTRPIACCCASRDGFFMLELPKPSRAGSARSPRASPKCWPVTGLRRAILKRPPRCGGRRGGVGAQVGAGRSQTTA